MKLIRVASGIFVLEISFEERGLAKQAGFLWNPERKWWYTTEPYRAAQFLDVAAGEALDVLSSLVDRDDPYLVLGIRRGESLELAEAAYRIKAKQFHPDATRSTDDYMMRRLNRAIAAVRTWHA